MSDITTKEKVRILNFKKKKKRKGTRQTDIQIVKTTDRNGLVVNNQSDKNRQQR